MARLSELPATAPRPTAPLAVLGTFAIVFGLTLRRVAFNNGPGDFYAQLAKLDTPALYRDIGVAPGSWPVNEAGRLLSMLVFFFRNTMRLPKSDGLILILASVFAPLITFQTLESLKQGRHALLRPAFFTLVAALGQVILIGAATNILWIPVYAYTRWAETSKKAVDIHPLPSPARWAVHTGTVTTTLAALTFLPMFLPSTGPDSGNFLIPNVVFQFFPLIFIPLFLLPTSRQSDKPRAAAADSYRLLSVMLIAPWWAGAYKYGPVLLEAWRSGGFKEDGYHVLTLDMLGGMVAAYLMVLIDSYADEARVKASGERVHHRRFIFEEIFGLMGLLMIGPGAAFALYFRRREHLAERARLGLKDE